MRRAELRLLGLGLGVLLLHAPRAWTQESATGADPTLAAPLSMDECVNLALEHNLELRIARTRLAATSTNIRAAYGLYMPEFSLTAARARTKHFGELANADEHISDGTASLTQRMPTGTLLEYHFTVLHDLQEPDRSDTPSKLWLFGLTQPLLRGGGWRAGTAPLRSARFETRIVEAGLQGTELGVVQKVKTAYYEVLRQAKLVDVNQTGVDRDRQLVLQSQSKLEAGMATKRDVLSAEIVYEQDRGKLVMAQVAHQDALDALALVMGVRLGRELQLADKDVELQPVHPDESAWIAKALRDNPTVRAAHLGAERERLAMRVAGNDRLPQLDLGVQYTHYNDPDFNEYLKELNKQRVLQGKEPKDLKWTAYRGWTGLLTFTYPLGNLGPGSAYRRARLVYEESQRNLEDAERQVTLEVRSVIRNLDNKLQKLEILTKNLEGARSKLEFAALNFQLGRASNLDVTDAQKDLLKAETDYVNDVIDYRIQLSQAESLLGGFE